MLQSLTQAKMMVSPQTDSIETIVRYLFLDGLTQCFKPLNCDINSWMFLKFSSGSK